MNLSPKRPCELSGPEVLQLIIDGAAQEREHNAALADALAERLTQSGKHDRAMVALQIAAQIRARK